MKLGKKPFDLCSFSMLTKTFAGYSSTVEITSWIKWKRI